VLGKEDIEGGCSENSSHTHLAPTSSPRVLVDKGPPFGSFVFIHHTHLNKFVILGLQTTSGSWQPNKIRSVGATLNESGIHFSQVMISFTGPRAKSPPLICIAAYA
jgi:hypothetical protein